MNREVIATGRTVDEALEKAYEQMGVSQGEAQFEIIEGRMDAWIEGQL